MENQRVARIDRQELTDLPANWSNEERGQYLRVLLKRKGVDVNRLYRLEYYPYHYCWLMLQEQRGEELAVDTDERPQEAADAEFYSRMMAEFRRTAMSAMAALAARAPHFVRHGGKYQLPSPPRELTSRELEEMLGGAEQDRFSISFDTEGGWQFGPSEN